MNEAVILKSELSKFVLDFGKMPLLHDEFVSDFEALKAEVFKELGPNDIFETFLAHEVVSYLWSEKRYRRLRDNFVRSKLIEGLTKQLEPYMQINKGLLEKLGIYERFQSDHYHANLLVVLWLTKDSKAFKAIDAFIKSLGTIIDDAVGYIHGSYISEISAFESLIREVIRNRNQSLADFYKRRGDKKKKAITFDALGSSGEEPPLEGG